MSMTPGDVIPSFLMRDDVMDTRAFREWKVDQYLYETIASGMLS